MPAEFPALPYDILFSIVQHVQLEDAVHLGLTCRSLTAILKETTLCRSVIENSANYSEEADWARAGFLTYEAALLQLYRRRTAYRRCEPYRVQAVGRAETLLCSSGMLCMVADSAITVRELKQNHSRDSTISLAQLHEALGQHGYTGGEVLRLLAINEGVLVVALSTDDELEESLLIVLKREEAGLLKLLTFRSLDSDSELFVRLGSRHLYYGTHSGMGDRQHHEWIIRGIDLNEPDSACADYSLQLEEFVGSEIGSTVDFKVHNGYFYAVSNQTSFVVEEVDWTSFYTVIRFPLGCSSKKEMQINRNIYRRQHADGPIHDSWTSLGLQHDEATNELYILESRREWLQGGSKQTRTFYRQPIWFEPEGEGFRADEWAQPSRQQLPKDDLFSTVVTSENNPRYAPRQELTPDQIHPEYGNTRDNAPSYIIAKTRLRSYNLSSSSFLELVEDNRCCGPGNSCWRLRGGTRRPAPLQPVPTHAGNCMVTSGKGKQAAVEPFRYSDISMWPPATSQADYSALAHQAMNGHLIGPNAPPAWLGFQVTAFSDERSLVFMVKSAQPRTDADRLGTIIFVSFEPDLMAATPTNASQAVDGMWTRAAVGWPSSS